jgi:hypothetical protein
VRPYLDTLHLFQPQPWLHFGASTSASDAFSRPVELLRAFSNSPWPWLDGHLLRGPEYSIHSGGLT